MDLKFSTKGRVNLLQMKSVSHFLDTAFKCEQLLPISTLEFSQLQGIWKFSFPLLSLDQGKGGFGQQHCQAGSAHGTSSA